MKIYSRYYTLKKLVTSYGWGWCQTNWLEKAHLLEMRREKLVQYEPGTNLRVRRGANFRIAGAGNLANFYTITFKGFELVGKIFPNEPELNKMKLDLFENIFENFSAYWKNEIRHRISV